MFWAVSAVTYSKRERSCDCSWARVSSSWSLKNAYDVEFTQTYWHCENPTFKSYFSLEDLQMCVMTKGCEWHLVHILDTSVSDSSSEDGFRVAPTPESYLAQLKMFYLPCLFTAVRMFPRFWCTIENETTWWGLVHDSPISDACAQTIMSMSQWPSPLKLRSLYVKLLKSLLSTSHHEMPRLLQTVYISVSQLSETRRIPLPGLKQTAGHNYCVFPGTMPGAPEEASPACLTDSH